VKKKTRVWRGVYASSIAGGGGKSETKKNKVSEKEKGKSYLAREKGEEGSREKEMDPTTKGELQRRRRERDIIPGEKEGGANVEGMSN